MKIILFDVLGSYNDDKDGGETMNFMLDDNSLEKIIDIFNHIREILTIDLGYYLYDDSRGNTYLKTKLYNETCFRTDNNKKVNAIPNEKTKYTCRVVLQIQSVYYSNYNKDIIYYPQVFLQDFRYKFLANNRLIYENLDVKILSQRANLKKNLMKIPHKDIKT